MTRQVSNYRKRTSGSITISPDYFMYCGLGKTDMFRLSRDQMCARRRRGFIRSSDGPEERLAIQSRGGKTDQCCMLIDAKPHSSSPVSRMESLQQVWATKHPTFLALSQCRSSYDVVLFGSALLMAELGGFAKMVRDDIEHNCVMYFVSMLPC